MRKAFAIAAALALLGLGGMARAAITIDTVAVGDKGNTADTLTGYGSVGYNYNIGKYEVTAGQYTAFLNAVAATDTYGLYSGNMFSTPWGCRIEQTGSPGSYSYSVASVYANRPVNYVSYWDSCRFANWLCNGQPTGLQDASTTERGAYTLNGYNGNLGGNIRRNAGATWAVTSEDEWYKAAYYKGGGLYSLYANGTNTAPVAGADANYNWAIGSTWDGTINGALEQNGTKDMMGNVWEWNEAVIDQDTHYAPRGLRGGSFMYDSDKLLSSTPGDYHYYDLPYNKDSTEGFRVVQAVPEPSSVIALLGGLVSLIGLRRRKA